MSALDWLVVFVLNAGVIAYGFYLARGTRTSVDWFLGARALPWWAVGISMFATNIDNADLVSVAGATSKEGIHIFTAHALGSVSGGILAAFFIVPIMYRAGLYTNAEYLEVRFGKATRVFSALIQIQYRTAMLGLMTWAIFLLLTGLVGLTEAQAWGLIVALVVLAAIYTAWGGLKSVVLTDAIQGIIMIAGTIVIFGAVWQAVGGWSGMVAALDAIGPDHPEIGRPAEDLAHVGRYRGDSGQTSPYLVALGWIIVVSGYWTVNHTQTMRLMGTRSLWDMKMAALFGTALSMPVMFASISLGVFGRALFPDFAPADQMYPHLADRFLVPGLKGLVVAGMIAAAISTFDSIGSALSAVFTRDIYARLIVRGGDDAHYLRAGRWATLGILAIGFAYVPFIRMKLTMMEAFMTLVPVFVTPLFTVYLAGAFTRAHRKSGLIGLLGGGLYGVVAFMDREIYDVAWLPAWFTGRWEAFVWSMLFTGGAMAVATLVLGRHAADAEPEPDSEGWLQRSRTELPPMKEHPFRDRVPGLLRPEWIAGALLAAGTYIIFVLLW